MVGQLRDQVQVVDHAAHQLAGAVVVEEFEGHLLQVAEEIAAHIRLHAHAHQVAPVIDKIIEPRHDEIQPQQQRAG